jgi:hypothetical protein
MKRFIAAALCSLLATLVFVSSAAAAAFTDTVKLPRDTTVTVDQPLETSFNVQTTFASISQVCLHFTFKTDLLDPGDFVEIFLIEEGVEVDIGGFLNPGQKPQTKRWFCWTSEFHPRDIAFLLDGETTVKVTMQAGSMTVTRLSLQIKGIPQ